MTHWGKRVAGLGLPIVTVALFGAVIPPASAATATRITTVVPVTPDGHPAPGYRVTTPPGTGKVSCGAQSAVSMSPAVQQCGTSADGGFACLQSSAPHKVLCLVDARKRMLLRLTLKGSFSPSPVASLETAPMDIVLGDGMRCAIRLGGADGAELKGHPQYTPLYLCDNDVVVWGKSTQGHYGVNESRSTWTVRTAPHSGNGKLVTHRITKAYFVGAPG